MNTVDTIGFALAGIATDQFAIFPEHFNTGKEVDFEVQIGTSVDTELQQMTITLVLDFTQKRKTVGKIAVNTGFKISPQAWDECLSGSSLVFPQGFVAHLASISVGIVRGIWHAKTENTPMRNQLIPILNITELVDNDVEFELE